MAETVLEVLLYTMLGVTAATVTSVVVSTAWLTAKMWVRVLSKDTSEKTAGERRMTEAATLSGLMTAISSAAAGMLTVSIYLLSFTPI